MRLPPPVLLLPALTGPACSDLAQVAADPEAVPTEVSYAEHVAPILEASCVRCHSHEGRLDGGVAVDTYESARSTRVRSTCVSVGTEVIAMYADVLLPLGGSGGLSACEGWEPLSMPPGAMPHLTLAEQLVLARWVEQGAPP